MMVLVHLDNVDARTAMFQLVHAEEFQRNNGMIEGADALGRAWLAIGQALLSHNDSGMLNLRKWVIEEMKKEKP